VSELSGRRRGSVARGAWAAAAAWAVVFGCSSSETNEHGEAGGGGGRLNSAGAVGVGGSAGPSGGTAPGASSGGSGHAGDAGAGGEGGRPDPDAGDGGNATATGGAATGGANHGDAGASDGGAGTSGLGGASDGGAGTTGGASVTGGVSGGRGGTAGAGTGGAASGSSGHAGAGGAVEVIGNGPLSWSRPNGLYRFQAYSVTPLDLGGVIGSSGVNGNPPPCGGATLGFEGSGQEMHLAARFDPPLDLTGKKVSAEIFHRAGWNDPEFPGRIKLYVLMGEDGVVAEGPREDILMNVWNVVTLDMTAPEATSTGTFAPDQVRELGIAIESPDSYPNLTLAIWVDNIVIADAD
jgi:hypothetical protein